MYAEMDITLMDKSAQSVVDIALNALELLLCSALNVKMAIGYQTYNAKLVHRDVRHAKTRMAMQSVSHATTQLI